MCIRDSLKPTPIDRPLELRGRGKEIKGRKVIVAVELFAHDELCARGEVVTVQVPDDFMAKLMNP